MGSDQFVDKSAYKVCLFGVEPTGGTPGAPSVPAVYRETTLVGDVTVAGVGYVARSLCQHEGRLIDHNVEGVVAPRCTTGLTTGGDRGEAPSYLRGRTAEPTDVVDTVEDRDVLRPALEIALNFY